MLRYYRRPKTMTVRALKLYARRHARQLGHEIDCFVQEPAVDAEGLARLSWSASSTSRPTETIRLEVEVHGDGSIHRWRLDTGALSRPPRLDLPPINDGWSLA